MSAAKPELKSLATRKQLLLIESQVNRAQLKHDWQDFGVAVRASTAPVRGVISIVQGIASAFHRAPDPMKNPSNGHHNGFTWLAPLLESARLGASLWESFRSRKR